MTSIESARQLRLEGDGPGAIAAYEACATAFPERAAEALCEAADACVHLGQGDRRRELLVKARAADPLSPIPIQGLLETLPERAKERVELLGALVAAQANSGSFDWRTHEELGRALKSISRNAEAAAQQFAEAYRLCQLADRAPDGKGEAWDALISLSKRLGLSKDQANWKEARKEARRSGSRARRNKQQEDQASLAAARAAVEAALGPVPSAPSPPPTGEETEDGFDDPDRYRAEAERCFADADTHCAAGTSSEELDQLRYGLSALLRLAVRCFEQEAAGLLAVEAYRATERLERFTDLQENALALLKREGIEAAGGVASAEDEAHLALLLDRPDLARRILEVSLDEDRCKHGPLDWFWSDYVAAFQAAMLRQPFSPSCRERTGYHRHFGTYTDWFAAVASGSDTAPLRELAEESFQKRNRDKRLTDWTGVNGDGRKPVHWDFRAAGILRLEQRARPARN